MGSFSLLLNPLKQCELVTSYLLDKLNIRHTKTYLQNELLEHPNYPSLISIADVLGVTYNISTVPLKISFSQLLNGIDEIKPPFVAHVKHEKGGSFFSIVTDFTRNSIKLYNPLLKNEDVWELKLVEERFQETILLVEKDCD